MEAIQPVVDFIVTYIFNQPFILLGLIALLGLVLQRKPFQDVVTGTLKTGIGYLILSQGTSILSGIVMPISDILNKIFNIEATAPGMGTDPFAAEWASTIALIMVVGFVVNLILARFTPFKYVYLTVHQTYYITFVYLALAVEVIANPSIPMFIIVGGIMLGVYCTLSPALVQPFMRKVTGTDELAYGHTTSFGAIAGALVGKLFKSHEKETSEDLHIPAKLSFLKDITVSTAIVMTLLYVVGVTLAGPAWVEENMSAGTAAYLYAITQGVQFGVGITIVLTRRLHDGRRDHRGLQGHLREARPQRGSRPRLPDRLQLCPHGRHDWLPELPGHRHPVRGHLWRRRVLLAHPAGHHLLLWRRPRGRLWQLHGRLARRHPRRRGRGPAPELWPGPHRRLPAHHDRRLCPLVQRL